MKKSLILLCSLLALASCGKKQAQDSIEAPASRNLVLISQRWSDNIKFTLWF